MRQSGLQLVALRPVAARRVTLRPVVLRHVAARLVAVRHLGLRHLALRYLVRAVDALRTVPCKGTAWLATALVVAGCSSVPLSTMWRMRSFDADQLFALDPIELRAAARVDSRVSMRNVTLSLEVDPADKSARRAYFIPLEQPVSDARLERAPGDRRWFAFALSKQGLAEYQRIKREYGSIPKGSRSTLKIAAADDGTVPADLKQDFPLRVDILLKPAEGYFTLISETRVDLSQPRK